jgi:hypothetical protein
MQLRKVIRRRLRHVGKGFDIASDINATIAANVNEGTSRKTATTTRGGPDGEAKAEGPSRPR